MGCSGIEFPPPTTFRIIDCKQAETQVRIVLTDFNLVHHPLAFNLAQSRYLSDTQCSMLEDLRSAFFGTDVHAMVPSAAAGEELLKCTTALEELDRVVKEAEIFIQASSTREDWWKCLHRADIAEAYEVFLQEITWSVAGLQLALGDARGLLNGALISSVVSRSCKLLKKASLREHVLGDWQDLVLLLKLLKQRYEEMSAHKKTLLSRDQIHKYRIACFLYTKFAATNSCRELPRSLRIDAADIKQTPSDRCLGAGVYERTWLGQRVAVKEFRGDTIMDLVPEAELLAKLRNPHIVSLIGVALDEKANTGFLVMEWATTNLHNWISQRSCPLSPMAAVDIMLQIARGMQFLHKRRVSHGDLKPSNILIQPSSIDHFSEQGHARVKLSDFGFHVSTFRVKVPGLGYSKFQETSRTSSVTYNFKSDVYSFGATCYEILTGRSVELPKESKERMMPDFPSNSPVGLSTLIKDCWDIDSNVRPTCGQIVERLRCVKLLLLMVTNDVTAGSVSNDEDGNPNECKWLLMHRELLHQHVSQVDFTNEAVTRPREVDSSLITINNRIHKKVPAVVQVPGGSFRTSECFGHTSSAWPSILGAALTPSVPMYPSNLSCSSRALALYCDVKSRQSRGS